MEKMGCSWGCWMLPSLDLEVRMWTEWEHEQGKRYLGKCGYGDLKEGRNVIERIRSGVSCQRRGSRSRDWEQGLGTERRAVSVWKQKTPAEGKEFKREFCLFYVLILLNCILTPFILFLLHKFVTLKIYTILKNIYN